MKLVGAVAIMAASLWLGAAAVREMGDRVRRAEHKLYRLTRLRSLVMSARLPIDEALRECGIELEKTEAPFSERWRAWADSPALKELGEYLTGVDEVAKRAAFERAADEAESKLKALKDKKERDTRLALALSATLGASAVILLI